MYKSDNPVWLEAQRIKRQDGSWKHCSYSWGHRLKKMGLKECMWAITEMNGVKVSPIVSC